MNPSPPSTCVPTRTASIAASVEYSLAIAAACTIGRPWILQPRRLVREVVGVLDLDGEIGELEGETLEAADRAAEGVALLGVLDRHLERRPGAPERQRRDRDPAVVEDLEEVAEPVARLAEQVAPPARGSRRA